jgi:hypothetical protein
MIFPIEPKDPDAEPMTYDAILENPLQPVTVTVYVPAIKLGLSSEVDPSFHK